VVFAGVNLSQEPAHAGFVCAENHKQVFYHETHYGQFVDDLNVGKPLLVGADFVLALYDIDTFWFQHSISLVCPFEVEIEHRFVVFFQTVFCPVIVVVVLEVLVILMSRATWRVHVWRIEHDAVDGCVAVRQITAIHP